jgi:hypothetical protein
LRALLNRDFHETNIRLHEKEGTFAAIDSDAHTDSAGPIVRIAPNEYSIDDPDAIKTIYGHGTSFVKVSCHVLRTVLQLR